MKAITNWSRHLDRVLVAIKLRRIISLIGTLLFHPHFKYSERSGYLMYMTYFLKYVFTKRVTRTCYIESYPRFICEVKNDFNRFQYVGTHPYTHVLKMSFVTSNVSGSNLIKNGFWCSKYKGHELRQTDSCNLSDFLFGCYLTVFVLNRPCQKVIPFYNKNTVFLL